MTDEQQPLSLVLLLANLSDLDLAAEMNFDPEQVVGDLKDKVDAIFMVRDRLETEAARLGSIAADFLKASRQVSKNQERLDSYVLWSMQTQGFDKLPGHKFAMQIQNKPPALIEERGATADDAIQTPEWVTRKVEYRWNKDVIKKALAEGASFQYGKVVQGQKVVFKVKKGEK